MESILRQPDPFSKPFKTSKTLQVKGRPPGLAGHIVSSLEVNQDFTLDPHRRADHKDNQYRILMDMAHNMDNGSLMIGFSCPGKSFTHKTMKSVSARLGLGYDATLRHCHALESSGIITIKTVAERRPDGSIRHYKTIMRFTLIGIKLITGMCFKAIISMRDKALRYIKKARRSAEKIAVAFENDKKAGIMEAARRKAGKVVTAFSSAVKSMPRHDTPFPATDPQQFLEWATQNPTKTPSDYRKHLSQQKE